MIVNWVCCDDQMPSYCGCVWTFSFVTRQVLMKYLGSDNIWYYSNGKETGIIPNFGAEIDWPEAPLIMEGGEDADNQR